MILHTHSRTSRLTALRGWFRALLLLSLAALLAACTLPSLPWQSGPAPTQEAVPTEVAGAEAEADPVVTGWESEPGSRPEMPPGFSELTAQDFSDPSATPSNLILFSSASGDPFAKLHVGATEPGERYVWAISPDGLRAGRISPSGADLATPENPNAKVKVLQNGFAFSHERVDTVDLPEECDPAAGGSCSEFRFSPSGRSLAYFSGSDACGRTLTLLDLETNKPLRTWPNAHWMYFMKDGSLVIALGGCDSQTAYLYIPKTGSQAGIEKIGTPYWNPSHTAVVFQVQRDLPIETGLWGFNLETSRVFLWLPKEHTIQDTPIWLADGKHFAFQHRVIQYDDATKDVILSGPRQIIVMDAYTRDQRQLGYDGVNDYHLCQTAGEPCEQIYGEWLRVKRSRFQPLRFAASGDESKPEVRCAAFGLDCPAELETLAINMDTRKQYPWEEARVPEPAPTLPASEPDLDGDPFFSDPEGEFALYLGQDGRSLWYVPRDREPSLWVSDGDGFVYLP